jgi:hypothetical protein
MTIAKPLLGACIVCLNAVLFPQVSPADYFSSRSGAEKEMSIAREASSKAFAGLGRVLLAFSDLEVGNDADSKESFALAARSLSESVQSFRTLASSDMASAKIDAEQLHPEDRSFINDPGLLALGTKNLNTAGDVYALTAGALSVALSNINTFRQNPSIERYAVVRDDISLLLRIGQVSAQLLSSVH